MAEEILMHTPGPWKVFDDDDIYPGIDGDDITVIIYGSVEDTDDGGIRGRTPAETKANARLIAAAPDLLAACQLEDAFEHYYGTEFGVYDDSHTGDFAFVGRCIELGWNRQFSLSEFVAGVRDKAIAKATTPETSQANQQPPG